jgi:hypothetical protein
MTKLWKCFAVIAMVAVPVSAYADDPTGVLLQERGLMPRQQGHVPRFSDVGPCQRGTQSMPFPNGQGFRCVRVR